MHPQGRVTPQLLEEFREVTSRQQNTVDQRYAHLAPRIVSLKTADGVKVCSFFSSPSGCTRGASCIFAHLKITPQQLAQYHAPAPLPVPASMPGATTAAPVDLGMNLGLGMGLIPGLSTLAMPNGAVNAPSGLMSTVPPASAPSRVISKAMPTPIVNGQRVCGYHLSPAGCSKGAECKFPHVTIKETDTVTEMQISHRSLPSASQPMYGGPGFAPAPFLASTYGTHVPRQLGGLARHGNGHVMGGSPYHQGHHHGPNRHLVSRRLCGYYRTERGCVKENACTFMHLRPQECSYFRAQGMCKKDDDCEYVHVNPAYRPAEGFGLPVDPAVMAQMSPAEADAHVKALEDRLLNSDVRVVRFNEKRQALKEQQQQLDQDQKSQQQQASQDGQLNDEHQNMNQLQEQLLQSQSQTASQGTSEGTYHHLNSST